MSEAQRPPPRPPPPAPGSAQASKNQAEMVTLCVRAIRSAVARLEAWSERTSIGRNVNPNAPAIPTPITSAPNPPPASGFVSEAYRENVVPLVAERAVEDAARDAAKSGAQRQRERDEEHLSKVRETSPIIDSDTVARGLGYVARLAGVVERGTENRGTEARITNAPKPPDRTVPIGPVRHVDKVTVNLSPLEPFRSIYQQTNELTDLMLSRFPITLSNAPLPPEHLHPYGMIAEVETGLPKQASLAKENLQNFMLRLADGAIAEFSARLLEQLRDRAANLRTYPHINPDDYPFPTPVDPEPQGSTSARA